MQANREAPVFSEGKVEIDASPEVAWDLVANVEAWPTWNDDVRSVDLEGPVAEGSVFRWQAGSSRIVSTFEVVDRPDEVGWTGNTMGIVARHVWRFEPAGAGAIVSMEESFEGGLSRLLRKKLQRQLDETTRIGLLRLKTAAEAA